MTDGMRMDHIPFDPAQWPEARGFVRVYARDPDQQARFIMVMLGFREDIVEHHYGDEETVASIDNVIRTFARRFPEFREDGFERGEDTYLGRGKYHMDERIEWLITDIVNQPDESGGD
jgi:hypothetical protein